MPLSSTPNTSTALREAGCAHLLYGYESFSPRVMKTIGKGATPATNEQSLRWTMESVNLGDPEPDVRLPGRRLRLHPGQYLGLEAPGPEREAVLRHALPLYRVVLHLQGSDPAAVRRRPREVFLLDLGDATKVTAVISKKFNAVEL